MGDGRATLDDVRRGVAYGRAAGLALDVSVPPPLPLVLIGHAASFTPY